jgi:hypothetical protein
VQVKNKNATVHIEAGFEFKFEFIYVP